MVKQIPTPKKQHKWLQKIRQKIPGIVTVLAGWVLIATVTVGLGILLMGGFKGLSPNPFVLKTGADWRFAIMMLAAGAIGITGIVIGTRHLNNAYGMVVRTLGIALVGALIPLPVVWFLIPSHAHYTAAMVRQVLNELNWIYYGGFALAIAILAVTWVLNQRHGWYDQSNWFVFVTLAPGLALGSVFYRNYAYWHSFVTSNQFTARRFARMLNDFASVGVHIDLSLANAPAFILVGFVLFMMYFILITGGVYVVQKARQRFSARIRRRQAR